MTLSSLTPSFAGDATSSTTHPLTMPTVADGDGAILTLMCGTALTPTLSSSGWTHPFTLVAALTTSGKNMHVYKATNVTADMSGQTLGISTGATSLRMTRGIVPIRGAVTTDIVDASNTKDGGISNATTATTPTLTTNAAGCGILHVVGFRRSDGVAGDWFTSLEPDSGQGLTKDFSVFSSFSTSTLQFNALCMAHDWTPRAAGASVPAYGYTADKAGTYYAVTLSIAALPEPETPAGPPHPLLRHTRSQFSIDNTFRI